MLILVKTVERGVPSSLRLVVKSRSPPRFCCCSPPRLIGKTTEDLATHTNQVLGGLINATFGNIVEMLLCRKTWELVAFEEDWAVTFENVPTVCENRRRLFGMGFWDCW